MNGLRPCTPEAIRLEITVSEETLAADRPVAEGARERALSVAREYLARFAAPDLVDVENQGAAFVFGSVRCVCGERLNGMMGTFRWGLAHGEGRCSGCGHPVRMYHRIDLGEEGEMWFTIPLLYLPRVEVGVAS